MAAKDNHPPGASRASLRQEKCLRGSAVRSNPMKTTGRARGGWLVLPLAALLCTSLAWGHAQATTPSGDAAPGAPTKDAQDDYIIGADDVLVINVWNEKDITRTVTVRLDGAISLPLVGEVQAAGKKPRQLEKEITARLHTYISDPQVTVIVQQMMSKRFNVLGEVMKPGSYLLTNSTTVLDAIALAGGFRDFAKQRSIYVLRRNEDGSETRLPFNYKDVVKGKNVDQNVKLQARDSVVVP